MPVMPVFVNSGAALIASPSGALRARVMHRLNGRCRPVQRVLGGADALAKLEKGDWQVLFLDRRLPDLWEGGGLRVVTLEHSLEEELVRAFMGQLPPAGVSGLQPSFARRILERLRHLAGDHLLCSTPARYHRKRLLELFCAQAVGVVSAGSASGDEVQSIGVLR